MLPVKRRSGKEAARPPEPDRRARPGRGRRQPRQTRRSQTPWRSLRRPRSGRCAPAVNVKTACPSLSTLPKSGRRRREFQRKRPPRRGRREPRVSPQRTGRRERAVRTQLDVNVPVSGEMLRSAMPAPGSRSNVPAHVGRPEK